MEYGYIMEGSGVGSSGQAYTVTGGRHMTPTSSYRLIPLTQGQYAIVDAADYEWLMQWKWYAKWSTKTHSYYAMRQARVSEYSGKRPVIRMHREILGLAPADERVVDHVNPRMTLDNRRENLRIAIPLQNCWNRGVQSNNKSGFKGVSHKGNTFRARIRVHGKLICLGSRNTPEEASSLYRDAADKYFGNFARCI